MQKEGKKLPVTGKPVPKIVPAEDPVDEPAEEPTQEPEEEVVEEPKPEEPKPEEPKEVPKLPEPKPVVEIRLDPAAGSEIQIGFMSYQNQTAQVEKSALEVQAHEALVIASREKLGKNQVLLEEAKRRLKAVLEKHGVPEGWNWDRAEDGSYTFTKPKPQKRVPGMPMAPGI